MPHYTHTHRGPATTTTVDKYALKSYKYHITHTHTQPRGHYTHIVDQLLTNMHSSHINATLHTHNPVDPLLTNTHSSHVSKHTSSTAKVDVTNTTYLCSLVSSQLAFVTSIQTRQRERLNTNNTTLAANIVLAIYTNVHYTGNVAFTGRM